MPDTLAVTVIDDGPLKISHARSVQFGDQLLETDGDVYLCRCGQSANAPFCDGSHKRVGFDGGCEAPPDKQVGVWEGRTIKTFFNPNTCMHVFNCKPLKALREQELAGDDDAAAEIMRVIATCPSGALSYETSTTVAEPPCPPAAADVMIIEGGEVRVTCSFEINAPLQERQRPERATLCRCGLSKNKPWCDGRHKKRENFR